MTAALPMYVFGERPRPVYHLPGELNSTTMTTVCGLTLWEWTGTLDRDHATRLRTDWAEQIGRPCHRCFPNPKDTA